MKIILSRKGFDSANGGIVSPIMEDGTLVSFPIPADEDDKGTFEDLIYCGESYAKILKDLNITIKRYMSSKTAYKRHLF